jgi:hypothetical protein
MTTERLLTDIEKPGTFIIPNDRDPHWLHALAIQVHALQQQGHAITVDKLVDHDGRSSDLRIYHYKTCTRCKRGVL